MLVCRLSRQSRQSNFQMITYFPAAMLVSRRLANIGGSRVGRWGSHAPIWYTFLTYIFVILKMSSKYGFACSHLEILSLGLVLAAFMAAILVAILNFGHQGVYFFPKSNQCKMLFLTCLVNSKNTKYLDNVQFKSNAISILNETKRKCHFGFPKERNLSLVF